MWVRKESPKVNRIRSPSRLAPARAIVSQCRSALASQCRSPAVLHLHFRPWHSIHSVIKCKNVRVQAVRTESDHFSIGKSALLNCTLTALPPLNRALATHLPSPWHVNVSVCRLLETAWIYTLGHISGYIGWLKGDNLEARVLKHCSTQGRHWLTACIGKEYWSMVETQISAHELNVMHVEITVSVSTLRSAHANILVCDGKTWNTWNTRRVTPGSQTS